MVKGGGDFFWNKQSRQRRYLRFCRKACYDPGCFDHFKTDKDYRIVEIVGSFAKTIGQQYVNSLITYHRDSLELLKTAQDNDRYCNPEVFDYEYLLKNYVNLENYFFSVTTVRYLYTGLEIIKHIKKLGLNNLRILEIGGGYGGQCKILFDINKVTNLNIERYTLVDLEQPLCLQKKYIEVAGESFKHRISFISANEIKQQDNYKSDFDFFISNYAFSELSMKTQNYYIDIMLRDIPHAYLLWNYKNNDMLNPFFGNKISGMVEYEKSNPVLEKNSHVIKY